MSQEIAPNRQMYRCVRVNCEDIVLLDTVILLLNICDGGEVGDQARKMRLLRGLVDF
jgi:hypothetical protein